MRLRFFIIIFIFITSLKNAFLHYTTLNVSSQLYWQQSAATMTRHGKNCTAGMVYTYAERQKDARQSGYGTDKIRTSKDSVKEFDCCCLTLQPCRNPVIT